LFNFFTTGKWIAWAWIGGITIFALIYYQVQLDVQINEWFGTFYNMIGESLKGENQITLSQYYWTLASFAKIAGIWVMTYIVSIYLTQHWLFRWRTSLTDWYHSVYDQARNIEGASQRVQEDTVKFSRLIEDLGTNLLESILLLIAFIPVLYGLSKGLPLLFFGTWAHGMIAGAILWTIGGTICLVIFGYILRLVGVEYDLQKREAAYRKILVIAEDDETVRPKTFEELYEGVRNIHYKSYLRYFVFNMGRMSYLQANVLVGYVLIGPAIVAGKLSLGAMQQILRAFNRIEGSMLYLYKSWPKIIELASVYKRLREFEKLIKEQQT